MVNDDKWREAVAKNAFAECSNTMKNEMGRHAIAFSCNRKRPSVFHYVIYVFNFVINCFHVHFDLIVRAPGLEKKEEIVGYRLWICRHVVWAHKCLNTTFIFAQQLINHTNLLLFVIFWPVDWLLESLYSMIMKKYTLWGSKWIYWLFGLHNHCQRW